MGRRNGRNGERAGLHWYGKAPSGYDERFGRWEAWCVGVFWVLMLLSWFRVLPLSLPWWMALLPLLWRPITDTWQGFARRPGRILAAGFLTGVITFVVAAVLVQGMVQPALASAAGLDLANLNSARWMQQLRDQPWLYVLLVLVGPFEEEVSYRYGLFRLLESVNLPLAHVTTGLVFGLQHVVEGWLNGHPEQLLLIPGFLVTSVVWTIAYRRTGNLLVSYVAHVLMNGIPLAFVLLS